MSVHDLEEARAKRALQDLNLGTDEPRVNIEYIAEQIKADLLKEADQKESEHGSNQ